jgi:hypothetical protein
VELLGCVGGFRLVSWFGLLLAGSLVFSLRFLGFGPVKVN